MVDSDEHNIIYQQLGVCEMVNHIIMVVQHMWVTFIDKAWSYT